MDNDYFLVTWTHEDPVRSSVMTRGDINDEKDRKLGCVALINKEVSFKWNKNNPSCIGKILETGSKLELEKKLETMVKDVTIKRKPGIPTKRKKLLDKAHAEEVKDLKILNLNEDLKLERELRAAVERECEELRDELKKAQTTGHSGSSVDIGNGIIMPKEYLTSIKSVSSSMNTYGRNIFKHLFEAHDIIGYSLMGKGCNANKVAKQPSIDPVRRDSIIEHVLATYGHNSATASYNLAKKDLKKSLACLIVEITKEAKQAEDHATAASANPQLVNE